MKVEHIKNISIRQYLQSLSRIQITNDVQKIKIHNKHVSWYMQSPYYTKKNLLSRCRKPVHYYKMALQILLQTDAPKSIKMVSKYFVSNTLFKLVQRTSLCFQVRACNLTWLLIATEQDRYYQRTLRAWLEKLREH